MMTSVRGRVDRRGTAPPAFAAAGAGAMTTIVALIIGQPLMLVIGIAGLAGIALMVLDERWAVGALAVFIVLHLPEVATDFHGAPSLFQPLIGAILLGVAARWAMTGDRPSGSRAAVLLVGTYVLVAISSLLFANLPINLTDDALVLVKDSGIAVVAGLILSRASSLRVVVWTMVLAGAFLATISVFQFATGAYSTSFAGFGQSAVEQIVGAYDDIRISGSVGDPNFYGQLLVVILPLALDRMWGESTLRLRLIGAGAAVVIAAATVLTFSRGAAVALGAVVVMMAVVYRPSLRSIAGVTLVGLLAIPLLPPGYVDRLTALTDVGSVEGATDPSIRGRTAEVTAGWVMFTSHPLTGVGYGLYPANYQEYVADLGIELRSESRNAHSLYLEVAAETGLPGILAMGALIVGAMAALARGRRRFEEIGLDQHSRIARALLASMVGFLITALFLHHDFARLFWLLIGISFAVPVIAEREAKLLTSEVAA
jgi:O-antigen ligase